MNYSQIESQVLAELNRSDIQPQVSSWVDRAYREIMTRHNFTWMKSTATRPTVAGTYRYRLPNDFYDTEVTLLIDGTNSRELKELLINEFDSKHPNPTSDPNNRPTECSVVHGMGEDLEPYVELQLWPVPNAVYTIEMRYVVTAPDLSGSMTPIVPAKYHPAIVYGALQHAFARLREYDASVYWKSLKDEMIVAMIREDRELPNVQRKFQPYRPSTTVGGSDHLSPFVRRIT